MTDDRTDREDRLQRAERELRRAWAAAIAGGRADRAALMEAVACCRDARLAARVPAAER